MKFLVVLLLLGWAAVSSPTTTFAATYQEEYDLIHSEVSTFNAEQAEWITQAILYACAKWQVDPLLVTAMLEAESSFSMSAVSPVGAIGIAQLMPGTASMLGVDPYNPLQNIEGGVRYLRQQLDRFAAYGQWATTYAIAAYNAGPQAVQKHGGVPPYAETVNYVRSIAYIYAKLAQ